MTPKLFKAADVCEMAQLQPYVLRSWEKEFPGIGVQKSPESPRLYRQSDVEQVLRIKQLVFGEGLTLSGARRRLEEIEQPRRARADEEVAEVLDALASDARTRIAQRARRAAVDSQAAVERAGHRRRRGRLPARRRRRRSRRAQTIAARRGRRRASSPSRRAKRGRESPRRLQAREARERVE